MPTMTDEPPGTYKVALYSGDNLLQQEGFVVNQDTSAKNAAAALMRRPRRRRKKRSASATRKRARSR